VVKAKECYLIDGAARSAGSTVSAIDQRARGLLLECLFKFNLPSEHFVIERKQKAVDNVTLHYAQNRFWCLRELPSIRKGNRDRAADSF